MENHQYCFVFSIKDILNEINGKAAPDKSAPRTAGNFTER